MVTSQKRFELEKNKVTQTSYLELKSIAANSLLVVVQQTLLIKDSRVLRLDASARTESTAADG